MTDLGERIYRKVLLRVSGTLALLIVISSIDRVNISFAALTMNRSIGLSASGYGLGAGLFFVGYLVFQLPSVALLRRWGARRWIAFSVAGWGLTSVALAAVQAPWQFFALRILLGAFESGFAPGVVWYVSQWLPQRYRSRSVGLTLLAIPVSVIIGGPLCGWLVGLGTTSLAGWRLMFLIEGAVTVALGLAALLWFVDHPEDAAWLSSDEKLWIAAERATEQRESAGPAGIPFRNPVLWLCAAIWLALVTSANALIFWLPSVVRQSGVQAPVVIGALSALPWAAIGAGMVLNARHSDRSGERFRHVGLASLLGAIGLVAAALAGAGPSALVCLVLCGFGIGGAQSVFWAIPTRSLPGAGAIAFVNLCGNASSAVAPLLIGIAIEHTGTPLGPVLGLALLLLVAAALVAPLAKQAQKSRTRSLTI